MPQITCEKTGITFDAKSARTRNHPTIMKILSEANRYGWYQVALTALDTGRKAGYTTIEQFVTQLREAEEKWKAARNVASAEATRVRAEATEAAEKAKRDRDALNAHLREHGYKWSKGYSDHDAYEEGELDTWYLSAPDGRTVSPEQALDEIKRGADVVLAEIAAREAVERAEAEAKAAAKKEVDDRYYVALKKARELPEVQPIQVASDEKEEIAYQLSGEFDEGRDQIFRFVRNGVECFITSSHGGYDADNVTRYFSADPEQAGLTRLEVKQDTKFYRNFFG